MTTASRIFDPARDLTVAPRDRDRVWELIRAYTADWLRPLDRRDGYDRAELARAEDALDRPLPAALREAYALIGRRADLCGSQDVLLAPEEIRTDGQALVFRRENQNCASWGVPLTELDQPDPSVVWQADPPDGRRREWRPFLDRVSLAILDMVLSESLLWEDDRCDNRELDPASCRAIERRYVRLAIPDYPLWAEPGGAPVRWFAGPDVLLWDHGRHWLWVRARTVAALERLRRELPGAWVYATVG